MSWSGHGRNEPPTLIAILGSSHPGSAVHYAFVGQTYYFKSKMTPHGSGRLVRSGPF